MSLKVLLKLASFLGAFPHFLF